MSLPDRPSSRRASGLARIFMVLAGVILLMPGLCAGFFVALFLHDRQPGQGPIDPGFLALWSVCFGIAAGGVALIIVAARSGRRRSSRSDGAS
jgi:hypothetical protein